LFVDEPIGVFDDSEVSVTERETTSASEVKRNFEGVFRGQDFMIPSSQPILRSGLLQMHNSELGGLPNCRE
jgi:hypothetical protein